MKKLVLILGIVLLIGVLSEVEGQNIAITDDNAYTAHSSAMLDVKSLTKGMLVPRMTTVQRTSIGTPATGLLVYDTNENVFYYYTGSVWTNMSVGQLWTKNGNYVYLSNTDDNVGIGVTTPENKLLVKADASTGIDESIFAVLNNAGDTVFAVYQEGVRIWVNDAGGAKANGSRGGFAVGGFNPAKAGFTNEYLRVTPDSVRVYIDETYVSAKANGSRGGFAVGGFNPAKGTNTENYMIVSLDTTETIVPSEPRVLWYPTKEAFLIGRVIIESKDSVGINSFASGFESKAIGNFSQALGYHARAFGNNSTAIGNYANANAESSFAMGDSAIAKGIGSYAFGTTGLDTTLGESTTVQTIANGDHSFAFGFGSYADTVGCVAIGTGAAAIGKFSMAFGLSDTAYADFSYAMGANSISSGKYSFAIGASNQAISKGSYAIGSLCVASGLTSFAIGYQDTASAFSAFAMGFNTDATEWFSTAMGTGSTASGYGSTAMGWYTSATNSYATSFGRATEASGGSSTAFGYLSNASGMRSTAFGHGSVASGESSTAFGNLTEASNYFATSFGASTVASGHTSTAMGNLITVSGYSSFGIGLDATSYTVSQDNTMAIMGGNVGIGVTNPLANLHIVGDPTMGSVIIAPSGGANNSSQLVLAEISGNEYNMSLVFDGVDNYLKVFGYSDPITYGPHLMIKRDGGEIFMPGVYADAVADSPRNLYINDDGQLGFIISSKRYKKNIKNMENTDWLYELRPVNFNYKKDKTNIKQYGLIAEEVELINPSFVSYNEKGIVETVSYSKLITPMLKALIEQKNINKNQDNRIISLENQNKSLKAEIENIKTLLNQSVKK